MRMVPLFERGQAALTDYVASLPAMGQPLGGTRAIVGMKVVTAADHDDQPRLVRRYVCANRAVVQVLCEDGHLCSVHASRDIPHW